MISTATGFKCFFYLTFYTYTNMSFVNNKITVTDIVKVYLLCYFVCVAATGNNKLNSLGKMSDGAS